MFEACTDYFVSIKKHLQATFGRMVEPSGFTESIPTHQLVSGIELHGILSNVATKNTPSYAIVAIDSEREVVYFEAKHCRAQFTKSFQQLFTWPLWLDACLPLDLYFLGTVIGKELRHKRHELQYNIEMPQLAKHNIELKALDFIKKTVTLQDAAETKVIAFKRIARHRELLASMTSRQCFYLALVVNIQRRD